MKIIYLLLLTGLIISCTKLESMDYDLSKECSNFSADIIDSLSSIKMEGLHYVSVDTNECVLTVKYENGKVKPSFFSNYLIQHEYHFIELNDDVLEVYP